MFITYINLLFSAVILSMCMICQFETNKLTLLQNRIYVYVCVCNSLPADIRLCESVFNLKTICSDLLSPPVLQAPLYLRTSRRYTDVLLLLLLLLLLVLLLPVQNARHEKAWCVCVGLGKQFRRQRRHSVQLPVSNVDLSAVTCQWLCWSATEA